MNLDVIDLGIVELLMMVFMGLLGYLWRSQASDVKQTTMDLNQLSIKFAKHEGSTLATNQTLFNNIEELKESIQRVENLLLVGKTKQ